jgi:Ran GTPase-activating protein (RanGAP) involved in mRNA processing and transport
VLTQCKALAHLNVSGNQIAAAGAENFAGVLAQCTALAHLNLRANQIGPAGAESLAGVRRSAQRWLISISSPMTSAL